MQALLQTVDCLQAPARWLHRYPLFGGLQPRCGLATEGIALVGSLHWRHRTAESVVWVAFNQGIGNIGHVLGTLATFGRCLVTVLQSSGTDGGFVGPVGGVECGRREVAQPLAGARSCGSAALETGARVWPPRELVLVLGLVAVGMQQENAFRFTTPAPS